MSCHHESCSIHEHEHKDTNPILLIIRIALSVALILICYFVSFNNRFIELSLIIISYLIIGYDVLFSALKNIIHGKVFDEHFLMALSSLVTLIVFAINPILSIDGKDGVLVMILYQLGEFLQDLAVDKSKDSIYETLQLENTKCIKIENDNEIEIDSVDIKVDDIIKILPGSKIPVDGLIIKGSSSLNNSSLTGESKPVDVKENDLVYSGCVNNESIIYIKTLNIESESTLSNVYRLIENASKNKAKSEKFITRFAKIYTPIVVFLSLAVMFLIPLVLGFKANFINYLYKGLSIMIISCPCSLVISIPLCFVLGIGKASKQGILLKGASYLDVLANPDAICFDKTGTITSGDLKIIKQNSNDDLFLLLLASMEANSNHPIALAIKNQINCSKTLDIDNIIEIPGKGMQGYYKDKLVLVGNEKLIDVPKMTDLGSVVYVSYDNKILGYVVVGDYLKEKAISTISIIKDKYCKDLYMITGDNQDIAYYMASKVGIDNVYANCLPIDKLNALDKIKQNHKNVIYLGDGINDAACLSSASLGLSFNTKGQDLAKLASDGLIMNNNLDSLTKAIKVAKNTKKIVIENIVLSLLIKVLVMILTLIFKLPMIVAIIADVGVCLLAIANSLRIFYSRK